MNPVEESKRPKNVSYEVSETPASQSVSSLQKRSQEATEEGNLEKVRDILFGTQSREFDQRCTLLEERFLRESADLKNQLNKSLDEIKAYIKSEVSHLSTKIQEEQAGRSSSVEEVGQVVQTLGSQLDTQLSGLRDQTTAQHQLLKEQLTQNKAELTENQQQALKDMQSRFEETVKALQSDKTDRAVLAEMLMDMALRLKVGQRGTEDS